MICEILDEFEIKYERNDDVFEIKTGLVGEDLPIFLLIKVIVNENLISLQSYFPFDIPIRCRNYISLAVSIANFGLFGGNFDFDYFHCNLFYRHTINYLDSVISKDAIIYLIKYGVSVIENYNDKFEQVTKNGITVGDIVNLFE